MASCSRRRAIIALVLICAGMHVLYLYFTRQLIRINGSIGQLLETENTFATTTIGIEVSDIPSYRSDSGPPRYGSPTDDDSLSNTVISWNGVGGMNEIITQYWKGNLFCDRINEVRSAALDPNLPITVNISFGCNDLYKKSDYGTGNFIAFLYGIRLTAHVYGNVGVNFTCYDAEETKDFLILPWLTGWFPPRPSTQTSSIPVSIQEACGNYSTQPLSYLHREMQYDLRKMAVALMGVPQPDHPSASFAEALWSRDRNSFHRATMSVSQLALPQKLDIPPFPATLHELDDAVLHFRCGDLMNSVHPGFSFMKFSGYTRHISPIARSIGILTQPFDIDYQLRNADSGPVKRNRCRIVVTSLVDYVKAHYPGARVRVHNSVNESIALAYARMIMANQTISGISSFGVIPALASFGRGYIRYPDYARGPNKWLLNPRIDDLADNIVLFHEPKRISVSDMKDLWKNEGAEGVIAWFWNDATS
jgi:hypothetical protein